MFDSTGGTFTETPEINTTYYLSSDNMVVHDTEVATLNGYVSSMIDAVTPESIGAAPSSHANDTTVHITAAERTAWDAKLDSFTETDPTVPAWAKATNKPTYTASEVGAVPTSRKVNGKALNSDITLSASDVNARPSSWTPSASDIDAVPTSRTVNGKALSSDITLNASDVGSVTISEVNTAIQAAIGNAIGGSY